MEQEQLNMCSTGTAEHVLEQEQLSCARKKKYRVFVLGVLSEYTVSQ